jgi:hypothetical protein
MEFPHDVGTNILGFLGKKQGSKGNPPQTIDEAIQVLTNRIERVRDRIEKLNSMALPEKKRTPNKDRDGYFDKLPDWQTRELDDNDVKSFVEGVFESKKASNIESMKRILGPESFKLYVEKIKQTTDDERLEEFLDDSFKPINELEKRNVIKVLEYIINTTKQESTVLVTLKNIKFPGTVPLTKYVKPAGSRRRKIGSKKRKTKRRYY